MKNTLSIIIPTFNDIHHGYLRNTLQRLSLFQEGLEVIVVDKASTDGTAELVKSFNFRCISTDENTRAARLNRGLRESTGNRVILHHPRSLIEPEGIQYLLESKAIPPWGGFTHRFDKPHFLLKFTSWYSNEIRGKLKNIFYLDHCIYINREVYQDESWFMPEVDIFEDTYLCQNLAKKHPGILLPFFSQTSALRFEKNGLIYQSLLNQVLKISFSLGVSPKTMNRIYEKGLELNSRYSIK